MKRIGYVLCFLAGCGPLIVPMPGRSSAQDQARIDRGWDKALTPVGRLDRDTWLDLLVGVGLFEEGVDKLYFRSEKKVSDRTVVMEIRYDRAKPDADRFTMEIRDASGKLLRREAYSREEVMQSAHALYQQKAVESETARAERKSRWATIREYFPERSERDGGADAPARDGGADATAR